jgi:hypothetical protein
MEEQLRREMRQASRQYLRTVWEMAGSDQTLLSDEDKVLLEVMQMHPEYYDLWDRIDEVTEEELEETGHNPVMHVLVHQTVENQIAAGDPPETAQTLERLMNQGQSRHEALHQIGSVVADEIYEMLKSERTYDNRLYVKKLQRLGRPRSRRRGKGRSRGGRS